MFICVNSSICSHFCYSSPTSKQWGTQFEYTQFFTGENSYKTDSTRTSTFVSVNFRTPSWQWVQDTAKSTYNPRTLTSYIDLNRAGIGLMEIVSEPDLRLVCGCLWLVFLDPQIAMIVALLKKLAYTSGPSNRFCVHWDQVMETWKRYATSSFLQKKKRSYFSPRRAPSGVMSTYPWTARVMFWAPVVRLRT